MFYWFLKFVAVGPIVKLVFRPRAEGAEGVPATGAAIIASNHLSAADWIFMPLVLKRRLTFLAKVMAQRPVPVVICSSHTDRPRCRATKVATSSA